MMVSFVVPVCLTLLRKLLLSIPLLLVPVLAVPLFLVPVLELAAEPELALEPE